MKLISGVGGVFVFSCKAERLADWYQRCLGLHFEKDPEHAAWYQVFLDDDPDHPGEKLDTTFAIIATKVDFSRPVPIVESDDMYGDQPYMLNLRTRDLESTIQRLKDCDETLIGRRDEPYGRFAWVRDADGNRVELYQPLKAG